MVFASFAGAAWSAQYICPWNCLPRWHCLLSVRRRLEGHHVETTYGRAHYRHLGIGKSAVLLVLLAGIGHDPSYWPEVLEMLAATHELIAIDLFGRGGTDAGFGLCGRDACADLVRQVICGAGMAHRKLAVCGFSFGGAVAAHVAATTESVVAAVLVVPAGVAVTSSVSRGISLMRKLPRGIADLVSVLANCGGLLCFGKTGRTADATEPGYEVRARRVWELSMQDFFLNPAFFRAYLHTLQDFPLGAGGFHMRDSFRQLTRLGSNLQLVVASEDSIIPAADLRTFFKSELPAARILEVAGGHDVQWDRPAETSAFIVNFLKSAEGNQISLSRLLGS